VHHTKFLLSFFILLFIAGCGGGSSFDLPPATAETPEQSGGDGGGSDPVVEEPAQINVQIVASLGLINGADVLITTSDGTAIEGASGALDQTGTVIVTHDGSYTGPILVTVTGNDSATYFDESAGTTLPMGSDIVLRAFAPTFQDAIGVTILTELAAQILDGVNGAVDAAAVTAANTAIKETLAPDVADILTPPTVVGEDNITAQALTNSDAGRYALRLAALASMAAGNEAPALSILAQLAADLADGDIDGSGATGAIADLDYEAGTFSSLFAAAVQLAASTLADADLVAAAGSFSVTLDANVLQSVIDAGVTLPDSVAELISGGIDAGTGGGGAITGDFDLTITGEIVTFGVGTSFEVAIKNIAAPSPSDTTEITQLIEETVAGVSNITNLQITVINNTADRITFEVTMEASQSGVSVTLNLNYDYVPAGTTPSDSTGGDPVSNSGGSTTGDLSSAAACSTFSGAATAATVPGFLSAEVRNLTYNEIAAGGPYSNGDTAEFVFSSSGLLFIDNVEVASGPVLCNGNEREAIWLDTNNGVIYSVSDLTSSFNEVNINNADTGGFLGQFSQ